MGPKRTHSRKPTHVNYTQEGARRKTKQEEETITDIIYVLGPRILPTQQLQLTWLASLSLSLPAWLAGWFRASPFSISPHPREFIHTHSYDPSRQLLAQQAIVSLGQDVQQANSIWVLPEGGLARATASPSTCPLFALRKLDAISIKSRTTNSCYDYLLIQCSRSIQRQLQIYIENLPERLDNLSHAIGGVPPHYIKNTLCRPPRRQRPFYHT